MSDQENLAIGMDVTDNVINAAQASLSKQYPNIEGL